MIFSRNRKPDRERVHYVSRNSSADTTPSASFAGTSPPKNPRNLSDPGSHNGPSVPVGRHYGSSEGPPRQPGDSDRASHFSPTRACARDITSAGSDVGTVSAQLETSALPSLATPLATIAPGAAGDSPPGGPRLQCEAPRLGICRRLIAPLGVELLAAFVPLPAQFNPALAAQDLVRSTNTARARCLLAEGLVAPQQDAVAHLVRREPRPRAGKDADLSPW